MGIIIHNCACFISSHTSLGLRHICSWNLKQMELNLCRSSLRWINTYITVIVLVNSNGRKLEGSFQHMIESYLISSNKKKHGLEMPGLQQMGYSKTARQMVIDQVDKPNIHSRSMQTLFFFQDCSKFPFACFNTSSCIIFFRTSSIKIKNG